MNISGLLRGFLGELKLSTDAKVLELKVGQIVKGVVLQLLSDQEALMNIGGVQVRARLEVPLKPGDSTLLQVGPESVNGKPVLKPLADSHTPVPESSHPEVLKELGFKDHLAGRLLIRAMEQELVPLTKESASQLSAVMKERPVRIEPQDWMQSAALALKRGLPPTKETVIALRQVVNGPSLYNLVERLGTEAEIALQQPQAELPGAVKQTLQRLMIVVRQLLVSGEGETALTGAGTETSTEIPAPESGPSTDSEPWISRVLKSLGVEHERGILRLLDSESSTLLSALTAPAASSISEAPAVADSSGRPNDDSLKGILLQLVRMDEAPQVLKDTVEQTLQHITGQQLLLTPDHATPFSHVTLFIPFQGDNGQRTASVHIQSRRGSRGELDESNCRLLFDLYMQQMGSTLVDVQVVDRVVSLNVHNDHDAVPALLAAYRNEIAESLRQAGFQLLSLKFSPYPVSSASEPNGTQLKTILQTKPYKGVDFRV